MDSEVVNKNPIKEYSLKKVQDNHSEIEIPNSFFQFLTSGNYNIQNICRLCLSNNNDLIYSLVSDKENSLLADMLTTLITVKISLDDELPTNICKACHSLVVQYYEFKIKCEKSDRILRSILKRDLLTKEELLDKSMLADKDNLVILYNQNEVKQETECVDDTLYFKNISHDQKLHIIRNIDKNHRPIESKVVVVKENFSTISEETECSEVQYLEDFLDSPSDDELLIVHDARNKLKKKIKAAAAGRKNLLKEIVLIKKRKSASRKQPKYYSCSHCSEVFFKANTFHLHVKRKHQVAVQKGSYACDQCHASFDCEHDLVVHAALHAKERSWKCNQCHKEYNSRTALRRHIQRHMKIKPHACEVCGKMFTELCALRRHMRVHTGEGIEKNHACHICDKRYSSKGALSEHISRHINPRPCECATCGKNFPSLRLLNSHMLVHTDNKPYACSYCDKRFRHESTRNTHHRTHTGEKPYVCSVCGKNFIQNSNLTLHMRTHTGERPYSCDMCKRRFSSRSTLSAHERVHTGERPYSCDVCGQKFARMNMTVHMRRHTGERPFACSACPKTFANASRLRDHCRIHTGEKPYSCEYCTKTFSTKSYLIKHMKSHEPPKRRTVKRELVILQNVPSKLKTVENTSYSKNNEEVIIEDAEMVENIDKTTDTILEGSLEVTDEIILQDDSNIKIAV